jgi:hypothetical protein
VFAVGIDAANQIRQRLPLAFGDILQTIPEWIFLTDAIFKPFD